MSSDQFFGCVQSIVGHFQDSLKYVLVEAGFTDCRSLGLLGLSEFTRCSQGNTKQSMACGAAIVTLDHFSCLLGSRFKIAHRNEPSGVGNRLFPAADCSFANQG